MRLEEQKCVPCEGGIEPLSEDEIMQLGQQIPGWKLTTERIEREFKLHDFAQAMAFANKIADIAEQENHHPDLHISYGKLRVELTTHAIAGLSINDFVLAAKINKLAQESTIRQSI